MNVKSYFLMGSSKKKNRKENSSCFFFSGKRYRTRRCPLSKNLGIFLGFTKKKVQNLFRDGFTQMTKSVEQLAEICKDGLDSFNIEKFLLPIVTHRNRIRDPFKFKKNKRALGHFMEKSLFAEKRQNNFLASRK